MLRALGPIAAFAVLAPSLVALIGLIVAGGGFDFAALAHPHVQRVIVFSALQAFLSTLISLVMGAALALALARRTHFIGRSWFMAVLATATVLPSLVVVFVIVAIYGRSGFLAQMASAIGLDLGSWLYGLPGILMAHAFQNIPFAARLYLHALEQTPAEHHRLAAELGMPARTIFRHLDWPRLRRETTGLAALIFLLCFISFAIVLALGGGPDRATLEVAIYDALRGEADFARAATLACVQIIIGLGLSFILVARNIDVRDEATSKRTLFRADRTAPLLSLWDGFVLSVAALFFIPPLLSLTMGVLAIPLILDRDLLQAFITSLALALGAVILTLFLAYAFARSSVHGAQAFYTALASMALVMPPFAMVAGLFFALRPLTHVMALGPFLIIFINALMALPFAYQLLETPLRLAHQRHDRLARSLGMSAHDRLRFIEWPLMRRPFLAAASLSAAFSLGDFGVIAFFGGGDLITLPLMLHQQLGAYRMQEASATALCLAGLVFIFALVALKDFHFEKDRTHAAG